jgi:hypothetical protein
MGVAFWLRLFCCFLRLRYDTLGRLATYEQRWVGG